MSKIINIPVDVYPLTVVVAINYDDEKLYRRIMKTGVSREDVELLNMNEDEAGKFQLYGRCLAVVRINRKPNTPEFYSTLSHELTHVVATFYRAIGMGLVDASEEAYAYLMGYLTLKIHQKL